MIIVTGGAGFIGANLIQALNRLGREDVLVVDDMRDGHKFANLADLRICDYLDREEFLRRLQRGAHFGPVEQVFHQGACSVTTEWDGRYMLANNFEYSKVLLHYCQARSAPLIYASSAAVYGAGRGFRETPECERPLNVYGYSKLLFDQYVRRFPRLRAPVVGLRYFNVYGPREQHKGPMASVIHHFHRQVTEDGEVRLFEGSGGYADGEQRRDFVSVDDAVAVNLFFMERGTLSGIYNVGTGHSQSFNEVARAVIDWHERGQIRYVPFPQSLEDSYQHFTEADLDALRGAGYERPFLSVQQGVPQVLDRLAGVG